MMNLRRSIGRAAISFALLVTAVSLVHMERSAHADTALSPSPRPLRVTTTYSIAPGIPIPDSFSFHCLPGSPGAVAESTIDVPHNGSVLDVDVYLNIAHPRVGDVRVTLTSPSGTTITLVDRPGSPADSACGYFARNIDTTLRDEASLPVENGNPPTGPSYTPQEPLSGFNGQNVRGNWTLRVTDYARSEVGVLHSWSLIITHNAAPTATSDAYSTSEDTPLTVTAPGVLANDTDIDGDPLTAVVDAGPAHGLLTLNGDGSFTYTPASNYAGPDSFTYHANDGTANSATVTVSITVNPVNDAPVAAGDAYSTSEDAPLNVPAPGVLANDTDIDGDPLTAVVDAGPAHGLLTLNGDGSFEYVPNPGFFGTDTFTYHATDGTNGSVPATVTIGVALVNGILVAHNDGTDMPMNTAIALDVLANDIDPDGDPLHIAAVTPPANGQVGVDSGRIVYTPHIGFVGTDSFTYTAADDFGGSDTATVTIIVWQPVPLCADFDGSTNGIVRAVVPSGTVTHGSVFCRVLVENGVFVRQSAEVGQAAVLNRSVIQAVDAFALRYDGSPTAFFNNAITVCLQGEGAFLYLDATVSPRAVIELPVYTQAGNTCALVPNAGTVVLVNGAASVVNPAPESIGPTTSLKDCMVTTRDILNLRETPSVSGAIIRMIPYDVTLTALERTSGWFYVDYLGERGWVSAGFVTPQGACGQ